jgi:hypothetical protein
MIRILLRPCFGHVAGGGVSDVPARIDDQERTTAVSA